MQSLDDGSLQKAEEKRKSDDRGDENVTETDVNSSISDAGSDKSQRASSKINSLSAAASASDENVFASASDENEGDRPVVASDWQGIRDTSSQPDVPQTGDKDLLPSGESEMNDENEPGGIFLKMKAFIRKSQENLLSIGSDKSKVGTPTTPEQGDKTILDSLPGDDVPVNEERLIPEVIEKNLLLKDDSIRHEVVEVNENDGADPEKNLSGSKVPVRGDTIDVEQSKRSQWDPPQPLTFEPADIGPVEEATASSSETVCPADEPGSEATSSDVFHFDEKPRAGASSIDRFDY